MGLHRRILLENSNLLLLFALCDYGADFGVFASFIPVVKGVSDMMQL